MSSKQSLHQSLHLLLVVFDGVETSQKNGKMMDVLFHISEVPQSFANSSSGRSEVAKSFRNVLVKPPNFEHEEK